VGLFARDVADAAWFAQALTGRALALDAGKAAAGGVVGIPDVYPWGEASPNARRAVALGRRALQAEGIDTRPCTLPPAVAAAFEAQAVIQGYEASRCLRREFDEHQDALSPLLRDYLQGMLAITPHAYEDAQRVATKARAAVAAWFDGFDALLLPSAPDEAPLGHASTGPSTFNRAWTLLGLPCVNVPGAVGDHGAPMGLQLVAPFGADARLLQIAERLEQGLGTQLASPAAPAPLS
jgi:Asp-tRNA(Asn)/Glu-tRNA(Gln) amidotransferase A subunit family amidase